MKTFIVFINLVLILYFNLFAQEKNSAKREVYLRIATSYSKAANQTLYTFDPNPDSKLNQINFAMPSIGQSINGIFGIGIQLHKNISVESNFGYIAGLETNLYEYATPTYIAKATLKNQQLLWQPTAVFHAKLGKFNPYIKVGAVLPMYNNFYQQNTYTSILNFSYINQFDYEINGELNLGLNGCVGLSFDLSDQLSIFIEAEETNTRTFFKEAILSKSSQGINAGLPRDLASRIIFGETNQNQFPISLTRESYNLGLKYRILK